MLDELTWAFLGFTGLRAHGLRVLMDTQQQEKSHRVNKNKETDLILSHEVGTLKELYLG